MYGSGVMDIDKILSTVDHTLLLQTATWEQIKAVCDDAKKYKTASVCIPPCYVKKAKEYVNGKTAVCTVVGFPNGYATAAAKAYETEDAIKNGADEIDMVINIGYLKAGDRKAVFDEISEIKKICAGRILKVIIETCLLTEEEKIAMCEIITEAGADYIKTSTGFSSGGAVREDIALFKKHIGSGVKIKAAGGIRTLKDAEDFIELGASRLGTSSIIKLIKQENPDRY